jgi:Flp pilus assembly protein protease CpaA
MWRPLVIAGAILVSLFSALPALAVVAVIRRARWPRPMADVIAGAACGVLALGLVVFVARVMGGPGAE